MVHAADQEPVIVRTANTPTKSASRRAAGVGVRALAASFGTGSAGTWQGPVRIRQSSGVRVFPPPERGEGGGVRLRLSAQSQRADDRIRPGQGSAASAAALHAGADHPDGADR